MARLLVATRPGRCCARGRATRPGPTFGNRIHPLRRTFFAKFLIPSGGVVDSATKPTRRLMNADQSDTNQNTVDPQPPDRVLPAAEGFLSDGGAPSSVEG